MALNSSNVLVALTGAVYVGPSLTALPTTTAATWNAAFVDLGYISEDGITESHDDEQAEIKAWQNGATVRTLITGSTVSFAFTLIETTAAGLGLYYKGATVTGTGEGPATVAIGAPSVDRRAFGFDVIDGANIIRWTVEAGEVSERGEISYRNDEAVAYPLTVVAYPATGGIAATKIVSALDGLPAGP